MNLAVLATIFYGLLSAAGGIWGYLKSKSKPSLISGCVSGTLLLLSAVLQIQGYSSGLAIAKIVILLLLIVFAIRLTKTQKFIPAGIMLVAGVISLSLLFA